MSRNAEEKKMEEYCFMIQPFDGGKFDKRYEDVFKPAIEAAGLIAYRVDNDDLEGLSYQEVIFLAAVLMVQDTPDEYVSIWNIKEQMKRSGFNEIAYSICARKLLYKKFIEISLLNDYQGNEYNGISITDKGNEWILKNENKFSFGCNNASNSLCK